MLDLLEPSIICQLLVNGVLFGAMYGAAAIGLSLIFGTMQIIFIAQGTMIILAAYGCYWTFCLLHLDPYLSLFLVVPTSLLLGFGLYHLLFRRVADEGKNAPLLIAFGLMVLLENLMTVLWTSDPRAVRTAYTAYGLDFMGLSVSMSRLVAFVLALLSAGGVKFFLKRTLLGKAVRAASDNPESATLVGITPHWVNGVTFALGIGLAGVAGVATATTYAFDPYFGFVFSLKALIAVALGGIGNVMGALLGGILLGVLESLASFFIGGGWADAISYGVFLLVLLFCPEGLFNLNARTS